MRVHFFVFQDADKTFSTQNCHYTQLVFYLTKIKI